MNESSEGGAWTPTERRNSCQAARCAGWLSIRTPSMSKTTARMPPSSLSIGRLMDSHQQDLGCPAIPSGPDDSFGGSNIHHELGNPVAVYPAEQTRNHVKGNV